METMRKKTAREQRESALASGWTVEAEPGEAVAAGLGADTVPDRVSGSAAPSFTGAAAGVAEEVPATGAEAGEAAEAVPSEETDDAENARAQLSNVALVVLGVLGGLYLLYSWVWLSWAQYYSGVNAEVASVSGTLGGVLQQLVFWAAPLAPALWFFSVLVLNRGGKTLRIALWLVVGAVVLFPLPLLSGGVA